MLDRDLKGVIILEMMSFRYFCIIGDLKYLLQPIESK